MYLLCFGAYYWVKTVFLKSLFICTVPKVRIIRSFVYFNCSSFFIVD